MVSLRDLYSGNTLPSQGRAASPILVSRSERSEERRPEQDL